MQALRSQGIDEPYISILEGICSRSTATIIFHKESDRIPVKNSVRQGDTVSLMLFTACLQEVFGALEWEELGIRVNGKYLSNLQFVDDIALMSN